ncbi:MAG: hypothetical protein ACRD0K_16860 [Egibacteraceae bacterium]
MVGADVQPRDMGDERDRTADRNEDADQQRREVPALLFDCS